MGCGDDNDHDVEKDRYEKSVTVVVVHQYNRREDGVNEWGGEGREGGRAKSLESAFRFWTPARQRRVNYLGGGAGVSCGTKITDG